MRVKVLLQKSHLKFHESFVCKDLQIDTYIRFTNVSNPLIAHIAITNVPEKRTCTFISKIFTETRDHIMENPVTNVDSVATWLNIEDFLNNISEVFTKSQSRNSNAAFAISRPPPKCLWIDICRAIPKKGDL